MASTGRIIQIILLKQLQGTFILLIPAAPVGKNMPK